jgi:fumarate reductase subunit C
MSAPPTSERTPSSYIHAEQWYRKPVPKLWWLRRRSYLIFVLRELSSVFVAWFVVFLLLLIHAVGTGPRSYQQFLDFAKNPVVITVNVIALLFLVFHAVTWFNVAPQAMVVRTRDRQVPPRMIAGAHYAAWAVVSAVVIWLVLRG